MATIHGWTFFREFLKSPCDVGTLVPSTRFLHRRLVALAEAGRADFVVELGPGPGGTTPALLEAMRPTSQLLAIEICPRFTRLLKTMRDPRLHVRTGSAVAMERMLHEGGFPPADVIVTGIPFSSLTPHDASGIVKSAWRALSPGGRLVAYQVRRAIETPAQEWFGSAHREWELRNIPPVRVYRWTKPAREDSRPDRENDDALQTSAVSTGHKKQRAR